MKNIARLGSLQMWWWLVLVALLLAGAWFRLTGGDWDRGLQINVDDSFVSETAHRRVLLPPDTILASLFDPDRSPINPRANGDFFPYGTLPIYATKAASTIAHAVTGDPYFAGITGVQLTGRALSGLFDLATMLIVVAMGACLWGRWWGLVAGALYAFAILPIQVSHFFIADSFMASFMAATLLCSLLYFQTGRVWLVALAGLCVGFALASKVSAAPILAVPLLAVAGGQWPAINGRWSVVGSLGFKVQGSRFEIGRLALLCGLLLLSALVGLFLGDPYALLDPQPYLAQLQEQAAIQSGAIDEWFTRKYVGTWPLLHGLGQLMLLGVGPLVGLAGALGVGVAIYRLWWHKEWVWALFLVGAGAYFAAVGFAEAKWVRYLLPLVPYLCLFAVAFLVWLGEWSARRGMGGSVVRYVAPGALLFTALLGALAITPIYRTEHTQIEASRWAYENIPAGTTIGIETTALRMPLALPGSPDPPTRFSFAEWDPLADGTTTETDIRLRAHLAASDYLILDTTQARITAPRLPWRYPVQIRYYDLLFSGQLGYTLAHRATSYPRLGPVHFPDEGWADVSFMDSSHPPIYIFKKERALSEAEWGTLFAEAVSLPSVATRREP